MRDGRVARIKALEFEFDEVRFLPPIMVEERQGPRGLSWTCETKRLAQEVTLTSTPLPLSDLKIGVPEPGRYVVQGFVTAQVAMTSAVRYEVLFVTEQGITTLHSGFMDGPGMQRTRLEYTLDIGYVRPWVWLNGDSGGMISAAELTVARVG